MTQPNPKADLPPESIHEPAAANPSPSKGLANFSTTVKPPRQSKADTPSELDKNDPKLFGGGQTETDDLDAPTPPTKDIRRLLVSVPEGSQYQATRYDTADQHVLSVYKNGETYDIRLSKLEGVERWGDMSDTDDPRTILINYAHDTVNGLNTTDDTLEALRRYSHQQTAQVLDKLLEQKINGFYTQSLSIGVEHVTSGAVPVAAIEALRVGLEGRNG